MTKPTFAGEVQFRRYSDSSTQGPGVYFGLVDRDALEAFIGKEGKRFAAVLVEIGEDEMPVPPTPRKDTRGPLCREACDYCEDPVFRDWLQDQSGCLAGSENDAKLWILSVCGLTSGTRKDLDTVNTAGAKFIAQIRMPFMRWRNKHRQAA